MRKILRVSQQNAIPAHELIKCPFYLFQAAGLHLLWLTTTYLSLCYDRMLATLKQHIKLKHPEHAQSYEAKLDEQSRQE